MLLSVYWAYAVQFVHQAGGKGNHVLVVTLIIMTVVQLDTVSGDVVRATAQMLVGTRPKRAHTVVLTRRVIVSAIRHLIITGTGQTVSINIIFLVRK